MTIPRGAPLLNDTDDGGSAESHVPGAPRPSENWAGNVRFRPSRLLRPRTIAELSAAIQASQRIRVVGSRHSFNAIAATDGTWLDLSRLDVSVTFHSPTAVEVPAAMTLREVNERLARRGLALASIGDIDHQQVGGLIATGTHGSGLEWGTMSDFVTAVKLVDGRGKLVELTGGAELAAARTHLGALGAVVSVTLQVCPAHNLERRRMLRPVDEVLTPEFFRAHAHAQLFHLPFTEGMIVRTLDRTDRPPASALVRRLRRGIEAFKENCAVELAFAFFGADREPARIPALMRFLQRQIGAVDDVGPSDFQMTSVRTLKYHELEMALDLAHVRAAFDEVKLVIESLSRLEPAAGRYYAHLPVTIRAVKGVGDNLLSPTLGRDTAYLSVTSRPGFVGYERYFRAVESVLGARFGARPHWAKRHWINPGPLYPGAAEFRRVCGEFDPEGKFRNAFVTSRLLGKG